MLLQCAQRGCEFEGDTNSPPTNCPVCGHPFIQLGTIRGDANGGGKDAQGATGSGEDGAAAPTGNTGSVDSSESEDAPQD